MVMTMMTMMTTMTTMLGLRRTCVCVCMHVGCVCLSLMGSLCLFVVHRGHPSGHQLRRA